MLVIKNKHGKISAYKEPDFINLSDDTLWFSAKIGNIKLELLEYVMIDGFKVYESTN